MKPTRYVQKDLGLSLPFVEYAWERFDVAHVLRLLLSLERGFLGQKQILFAALGAWIVAPQDNKLRQTAIIRAVRQKLVRIETIGVAKAGTGSVIAAVRERLTKSDIALFHDEVYFPIGGLKTLTGAHSRADFLAFFRNSTQKVETALEIAEVYHFHSLNLSARDRYRPASLNAAAPLVIELNAKIKREGGSAIDNIKKQWRTNRSSIALAYAAASMRFSTASSYSDLLHVIQSGDKALKSPSDVLPKLIGRARFIEETVLSKTYQNKGEGTDFSVFGVEAIPFKLRRFGEGEQAKISRAFARYANVG